MPKAYRDFIVLASIMIASCLDAMENDATTTTSRSMLTTSTSMSTTTLVSTKLISTKENTTVSIMSSTTARTQDDKIPKNISHASSLSFPDTVWQCPNITKTGVECSCDFPHTLRCTGDRTALQVIVTMLITVIHLSIHIHTYTNT